METLDYDLQTKYKGDKYDKELWNNFLRQFKNTFISTTKKKDPYIEINKLKMKNGQLDEYIANYATLISELGWHNNNKMTCHTYQKGLPNAMVKNIITQEGMPIGLEGWIWWAKQ